MSRATSPHIIEGRRESAASLQGFVVSLSKHNERCQTSDGTRVCTGHVGPRGGGHQGSRDTLGLPSGSVRLVLQPGQRSQDELLQFCCREGEGCPTWSPQSRGERCLTVTARVATRPLAVVTAPLRKLPRAVPGKKREMFSLNNGVTVRACFRQNSLFSWCSAGRWGRER